MSLKSMRWVVPTLTSLIAAPIVLTSAAALAPTTAALAETVESGGRYYSPVEVKVEPGRYRITLTNPPTNPTAVVWDDGNSLPDATDDAYAPGEALTYPVGSAGVELYTPGAQRVFHVAYTPMASGDVSTYSVVTYVVELGPTRNPYVSRPTLDVIKVPTGARSGRVVSTITSINGVPAQGDAKLWFAKGAITAEDRRAVKSGTVFGALKNLRLVKSRFRDGRAVFRLPKLAQGIWKAQVWYMGSAAHVSTGGQLRSFVVK